MLKIKNLISLLSISAVMFILTVGVANAQDTRSEDRPEVGKYAEVYEGEKKLQVTIVRLGPREDKEALVEIVGIDHPWDNRIFRVKVSDWSSDNDDKKIDYVTKVRGEDWNLLNRRGYSLQLNLRENGETGKEQNYDLYYSEKRSNASNPEYILTAYLEQEEKDKERN